LVVGFGSVPFTKAVDMNVFGVTTALAWGNERVVLGIFLIKTHVTNWIVSNEGHFSFVDTEISVFFLRATVLRLIIRIFCLRELER
jgi:hypothetical protein